MLGNKYGNVHMLVYFLAVFITFVTFVPLNSAFRNTKSIQNCLRYYPDNRKINDISLQSAVIQNADLTPAIDKYVRFPSVDIQEKYLLTAKGPAPNKCDPFALVADDLQPLSDYVKDLVSSENPVLTMAASHFFDQVSTIPY
jgi:hypothetical protein